MNIFQVIHNTVREELKIDQPLPPFFEEAIDLLSKGHIYYRTYKHLQAAHKADKDPSKGSPAVYGAAVQLIGDYTSIGSWAVKIALVTKCTHDLLRQYRLLGEEYKKFNETVEWQYPLYQPVLWKQEEKMTGISLSPSLYFMGQIQIIGLSQQILKIARCAPNIFYQMFKLSMCLSDIYLICQDDATARFDACTELIGEWDCYQSQLEEDREYLLEELEKGSELSDRLLANLGINKDSAFILDKLKDSIHGIAENAQDIFDDMYDVAHETLDTLYTKGKIAPLHIDLSEGNAAAPALPLGRVPPWAGQKVPEISNDSPPIAPSPIGLVGSFLFKKIIDSCPVKEPVKGIINLAKSFHQFYHKKI